ncbi:MAG: hypothetical protein PHT69_16130 [Bacteroidales bacterium]|nr:hypothetical protein [Bacteroidales bacterium]
MNSNSDIYLVEYLEHKIFSELVKYIHEVTENFKTVSFDNEYMTKYISGPLMVEFKELIYSHINKLNNFEINKYLTLSLEQFNSHKPENRKKELKELYLELYWFPNTIENKNLSDYDKAFFNNGIRAYERFFFSFKSETEKALIDFKSGLIGAPGTFQPVLPVENVKDKISYRDFKCFLKHLEYNYAYDIEVVTFWYYMRDDIKYLKKEIFENLFALSTDEKSAYLNLLRFELESLLQYVWATTEDINKWLEKYNISEDELFVQKYLVSELYHILNKKRPTFAESLEPDFDSNIEIIQDCFYNYYYGKSIKNILDFITEQESKLITSPQKIQSNRKLKTNLSVPQLTCLFKALLDNKIIDAPVKMELYRFISESFETKGSINISVDKIKNLFENPDEREFEFWDKRFLNLKQYTYSKLGN